MALGSGAELARWARALEVERAAKDAAFRQSADSPVPAAARAAFRGLDFFPPDASLRFRLALQRVPEGPAVALEASHGAPRRFHRVGFFEMLAGRTTVRLWAFRAIPPDEESRLFVPFRDATSGAESYDGGRYLDLVARDDGDFDLDFNQAYNPYCAYSDAYSCPLPPPQNWLAVPIRAGEKRPRATSR